MRLLLVLSLLGRLGCSLQLPLSHSTFSHANGTSEARQAPQEMVQVKKFLSDNSDNENFVNGPLPFGINNVSAGDHWLVQAWVVGLTLLGIGMVQFNRHFLQPLASKPQQDFRQSEKSPEVAAPPSVNECTGIAKNRPTSNVAEQFFKHAVTTPQAVALVVWIRSRRQTVTYMELADRVKSMARQFVQLGVKPGDRVILRIHRGLHQMVAVYASMASGAVFVPVDPDVPAAWLKYVLEDSGAALLVEESGVVPPAGITVKAVAAPEDGTPLRDLGGSVVPETAEQLPVLRPTDPVVIFYTSGSTGKPKGVLHSHEQLVNAAIGIAEDANVTVDSIVLLRSPAVWSTYEWEAFPALMVGATLIVAAAQGHKDPVYLANVIQQESVNMIAITPKSLDLLLDAIDVAGHKLSALSDVASTGEQLPTSLANRFVKMLPHARLHNGYNPTESAACTWYTVPSSGLSLTKYPTNVPAGLPQPGVSIFIMDPDAPLELRQLKEGEEGEIMFGGLLSEGYWNRPQLTAEKFVQSKFGRLYHSGDKGKWQNGMLLTLGRIDRQVKVKGARVEPEEVEAIMSGCWSELRKKRGEDAPVAGAGVACVASLGDSPELVAFVAPTATEEEMAIIEKKVKQELPVYYVPSRFTTLDALPALPNGKVNLKALQELASEVAAEGVEIEDSLGAMKKMLKYQLDEQEVFYHGYSFWMLGIMSSHSHDCGALFPLRYCQRLPPSTPGWVELVVRAIGSDQCVFGMIGILAYEASRAKPGVKPGKLYLGYQDAALYYVYVLFTFLNGFWVWYLYGQPLGQPLNFQPGGRVALRWFLQAVFIARLWMRFCTLIEDRTGITVPPPTQILLLLFPSLFLYDMAGDMCANSWAPNLLKVMWAMFITPGYAGADMCSTIDTTCSYYAIFYATFYHYSQPVVAWWRNAFKGKAFDGPCTAIAAFGAYHFMIFWAAYYHFAMYYDMRSAYEGKHLKWLPFDFAFLFVNFGFFVYAASYFPFSLSWTGRRAVGIYVCHNFFLERIMGPYIQPWVNAQTPMPGLNLLILMLVPLMLFMAIGGPICNELILFPVKLYQFFYPTYVSERGAKEQNLA